MESTPIASRPEILPLFTAAFIIGLQFAGIFPSEFCWFFLILSLLCIGLNFIVTLEGIASWATLFLASVAAGIFVFQIREEPKVSNKILREFDKSEGCIEGSFTGELKLHKRKGMSFCLDDVKLEIASQSINWPGKVTFETDSLDLLPEPGQRYIATGTLRILKRGKSSRFTASTFSPSPFPDRLGPLVGWTQRRIRDGVASLLPPRHQALMIGFLLGDCSHLSPKDRELFRNTGITHLLAVSGQHIMVLAFFIAAVLCWAGIPPLSRGFILIGFLAFYALVTAGQPSVWRAVAMYAAAFVIFHLEADPGPIRPIALAALILLFIQPAWIGHIGFQLSFIAVLGIILGSRPLEDLFSRWKIPRLAARYLAVSTAANLAVVPLGAYHFGYISMVSFILNPLIVWTFEIILPLGIVLSILGNVWLSGGLILAAGLSLFLDAFLWITQFFAALPFSVVEIPFPGILAATIYAAYLWRIDVWAADKTFAAATENTQTVFPGGKKAQAAPIKRMTPKIASESSPDNLQSALAMINPLSDIDLIETIDRQLAIFPKRSLKSKGNIVAITFPINKLALESQMLYHRLDDLAREVLRNEPDRLFQAQIFALALMSSELLTKVSGLLSPPPTPSDLTVTYKVKNKHLAHILLAEAFYCSSLPARTADQALFGLIEQARRLHIEGRTFLGKLIRKRSGDDITPLFEFRGKVLKWCQDLIALIEGR